MLKVGIVVYQPAQCFLAQPELVELVFEYDA